MTEPPQFKVELVKPPFQLPVKIVEPVLMVLTELPPQLQEKPVLPHPLVIYGDLGLVIYDNKFPQIS